VLWENTHHLFSTVFNQHNMTSAIENNIIKILSRLDIPGNAAKIYLFLLKNGPSSEYRITKVSGVNSGVVYRELERLKSKNLVFESGVNQKI